MIILGVYDSHNCGAGVVIDGELVAAFSAVFQSKKVYARTKSNDFEKASA